MEPVTPPLPPYHDALRGDDHCFSFWASSPTYANPHDLELPPDTTWTDLDGFHLSSPKLQDGVNSPSPDAMEPLVDLETNWSSYQPPEDRLGDLDEFLSGFCSGVDAGRITGYTECLQACLAGLFNINQSFPADGVSMEADGRSDHVDYGRRCGGDLSPTVLTLSEDQIMRLSVDDDNFPQDDIGLALPVPCGENGTQQGVGPDDLTAGLWPLDSPSGDYEIGTQQGESPDDLAADFWSLDSPSGDYEIGTQQEERPDDLTAGLWPLDSPPGDYEVGTQQGESPDELMADLWSLDSSSGSDTSNSAAATCINLTGSDDEDGLPLNPSSGGGGTNSPATVICIDLTGSDDRDELTESDEDDELPPLSVLLQRAKRPRNSRVR